MPVNVTYYFLYLLEATDSYREKFDDLSKEVRNSTENLKKIYKDFIGEPVNDPVKDSEVWCKLRRNIDGDEWEVKYYKERVILKISTKTDTKDLNKLFKEAKRKRNELLKNELVNLENIQKQLRRICKKFLFSWDNIENDNDELKKFLNVNYSGLKP